MGLFRRKKTEVELDEVSLRQLRYASEPWKTSWKDPRKHSWIIDSLESLVKRSIYLRTDSEVNDLFRKGLYLTTDRDIATDSDFAILVGQTAAKLGYVSRHFEELGYSPDTYMRLGSHELTNILQKVEDQPGLNRTAEAASRLATWPSGFISDLDPSPLWYLEEVGEIPIVTKVPGIGWPARSVLADRLLPNIYMLPDAFLFFDDLPSEEELKVAWIYGFILHVYQEVAPEESALGIPQLY